MVTEKVQTREVDGASYRRTKRARRENSSDGAQLRLSVRIGPRDAAGASPQAGSEGG
jgi:hypothetical protein